jgi:hypothetical protein
MNAFAGKRAPTGSVVKAPFGHGLTGVAISRALPLLTAQQKIKKQIFIYQSVKNIHFGPPRIFLKTSEIYLAH